MRAWACLLALGLLVLPRLAAPAHAQLLDGGARTECKGTRCVGSYCNQDGDALNCWQESVYQRKADEVVHWVCFKPGHKCKWITGPVPDNPSWSVLQLGTDR
jgi:hypothetical protein